MNFSKAYNRTEFVKFLKTSFLPDDFLEEETNIELQTQTQYTQKVTKIGACDSLDLVVYEIKHNSENDARVSLSKEAFRLLSDEFEDKALVLFLPESDPSHYRFSLITIDLDIDSKGNLIKEYSNPRRYSYFLGENIPTYTPHKYLVAKGRVKDAKDLQDRFSVEVLTKEFYNELSDWFAWALTVINFPYNINNSIVDRSSNITTKQNTESTIRLITRIIFVWFLKQKKLIPNEFFDESYLSNKLLNEFQPNSLGSLFEKGETTSNYYKAILQNLFFAMLNSPITPEGEDTISERHFRNSTGDYDNNKLMRYQNLFKNPQLFINLANNTVPFLNGGLFDCLDDKDNDYYVDGFSDREAVQKRLSVPDYLFFGEKANLDLSHFYGEDEKSKKSVHVNGLIHILKKYNFTVEENTPFDQEVSLDPELLGKVFENLLASYNPETKTTARKQTGSFYTPREIVQYMVDESLIAHLKRTVGEELEEEFRKLLAYTDNEPNLSSEQKQAVIHAIYNCKILDPACGSGAFPVGILQQMVHILSRLDPKNTQWKELLISNAVKETEEAFRNISKEERATVLEDIEQSFNEQLNRPDYARKLYLIENCIYGVDIQPIAIQISKLRFFISLVVDQKTTNKPEDNFGIRPLPNLEAKFVAADSLIPLEKDNSFPLFNTEEVKQLVGNLKTANHKIFSAKTVRTKRKYKKLVKELRQQITVTLQKTNSVGNNQAKKLEDWDMFNQNEIASFFDPEWMFGVSDGFDIVIGNPPYIKLQNNKGYLDKKYRNCNFKTHSNQADIYCLFCEKAISLLKDKGILCFITSNKWMRSKYGKELRKVLGTLTSPIIIIDFGGYKVFESASVDTSILLSAKEQTSNTTQACVISNNSFSNLYNYIKDNAVTINFNKDEPWVILTKFEKKLQRKIAQQGVALEDLNIEIRRGILTGLNNAFVINKTTLECLIKDSSNLPSIIKPLLRGKDLIPYGYTYNNYWLINTHNGYDNKSMIDINHYPTIKEYLSQFEPKLSKRYDKGCTPYNLRNCAYLKSFDKEKIAWASVGETFFSYIPENIFLLDTNYFFTTDSPKYFLALLNSKTFRWYINTKDIPIGSGKAYRHYKYNMLKLPIIQSNYLSNYIKDIEIEEIHLHSNDIDEIVFNIYNLSHEEKNFLNNYNE